MSHFSQTYNFLRWNSRQSQPAEYERDTDSPTLMVTISVRFKQLIKRCTTYLPAIYKGCNPHYNYDPAKNPTRCLTFPEEQYYNDGFDNIENDYILHVNDSLVSPEGQEYIVLDFLGKGTFGQVVKCRKVGAELCAAKVIKNKPAYFYQGLIEVKILGKLNQELDPQDENHIVRMLDFFVFRNHLVIIFELLSHTIFDILQKNQFRGFNMALLRVITEQLLSAMSVLHKGGIIHCDLKPENVLLKEQVIGSNTAYIKLIDFGSACFESATIYTYIQSRYYRSPEVLLGVPYGSEIDTWSLGCIVAEMFIGIPLFPGNCEYDQIARIVELLGLPPQRLIEVATHRDKYFIFEDQAYRFKTREEYEAAEAVSLPPSRRWIRINTLDDLLGPPNEENKEKEKREGLIDFMKGTLQMDPVVRWSPEQAWHHPFVQNTPLVQPFVPPPKEQRVKNIPTGSLRHGSCPGLLERISGGSQSSASSTNDVSYRPQVNELPDEFFKGFVHGKLADFNRNQRWPTDYMGQSQGILLTGGLDMIGNYMINPVQFNQFSLAPDIRGPRHNRHSKKHPYSYGHEGQYTAYEFLKRPQSPRIDDEKQKFVKKHKQKQRGQIYQNYKNRSSSQFTKQKKKQISKQHSGSHDEERRPSSPPTVFNPNLPIDDFYPPLNVTTPRMKSNITTYGEGGFLSKVAQQASQQEDAS